MPYASTSPRGRASWSGILQLSLVALPVKAYPAVSTTETIRFNQLHAGCQQRIRQQRHCPVHGHVETAEIVKGYQYAPDQYVVMEESELDQLRPAKEKGLLLEQFVDEEQLEPARFAGRTLFLFPDGLAAQRSYRVITQAMQTRRCCAIGRVVMSGRRQAAVVRPSGKLLWMHLLHDPALLRSSAPLETDLPNGEATPQELDLACALIDAATGPVAWEQYGDDTSDKLAQLIEAKLAGHQPPATEEEPVQILQLIDALQESVNQVTKKAKKSKKSRATRTSKRRSA